MRVIAGAVVLSLLLTLPLHAQPAGEADAAALLDQVKRAYRETRQYLADVHFTIEQQRGRWHTTQSANMPLAFDRDTRQVVVDRPDMRVVVTGNAIKLKSDNIRGRHLDAPLPVDAAPAGPGAPPITYQVLTGQVPYLGDPPHPGLAFLLEQDPIAALTMGAAQNLQVLPPAEGDELARPRLRFARMGQTFTLTIDPETYLIAHALIETDPDMLGGLGEGDYSRWTFDHQLKAHNQALPPDTFAFDAVGVATKTLQELMAPPDAAQMQQMQGAVHEGKPAPALQTTTLTGDPFDLTQPPKKVVVLRFWATWCAPCAPALEEEQEVYDWAQREGKDVAIYAVNMAEQPEQIIAYWEQHGLTLPVLLDPRAEVSVAWGIETIPASFIIEGGVIRKAHVGFAPGQGETIKAEIAALLGEALPEPEKKAPPAPR